MGGIFLAWLAGEGIIVFRSVRKQGGPPWPGQLLWSSGAFVILAVVGTAQQARTLANMTAWGLVAAAFLDLFNKFPPQTAGTGWWDKVTQSAGTIPAADILPPGGLPGAGRGQAAGAAPGRPASPGTPARGPAPGPQPVPSPAPGPSPATPGQIRRSFPIIGPRPTPAPGPVPSPAPGPRPSVI